TALSAAPVPVEVPVKTRLSARNEFSCARERCAQMGRAGLLVADEFGRPARSTLQDARAWRTGKERLVPENERIFMINGGASCGAVQRGGGDPALLLGGAAMWSWPNELCDRLVAGGRRVIRYDVRDTGRSESYPPGEPGYSLADLADDAVGVLDATATERAHVAGMSTGGWIAQLLA